MKEFVTERGWEFKGMCGCNPPMAIYMHPSKSGMKFHIGASHFQLKQANGVGVWRDIASGTKDTIAPIYEQHINKTNG